MTTRLELLGLQMFARPPRLLLVTPAGDHWAGWAGRGLLALSRVWGGCASVVVPADVIDDLSLAPLLRRFQPDHVLAFRPLWSDWDALMPGAIEVLPCASEVESALEQAAEVGKSPYEDLTVTAAHEAAQKIRRHLGSLSMDDRPQLVVLGHGPLGNGLVASGVIARADVVPDRAWGVPAARLHSRAALAAALTLGVQPEDPFGPVDDELWIAALLERVDHGVGRTRLLTALAAGSQDTSGKAAVDALLAGASLLDPAASRCTRLRRGRAGIPLYVVVGSGPADMALAGLCKQVLGDCVWLPSGLDDDEVLRQLAGSLPWFGAALVITSASVPIDELHQRVQAVAGHPLVSGTQPRPLSDSPLGYFLPHEVAHVGAPQDLDLTGRSFVTLQEGADQRLPLAVEVDDDGETQATLPLPPWVPAGMDADRHKWLVTVIATARPVPPHQALSGSNLLREGTNAMETFLKPSDGGITFSSHRFDFVSSGALLAGKLAGPALAWPSTRRLLDVAVRPPVKVQVSPAGYRASRAEHLLGSRQAVEAFAAGPGWHLAQAFLDPPPDGSVSLHQQRRHFLSWSGIQAVSTIDWEPADRAALRDTWTTQGVLRRGLVLGCEHCPTVEFYPLIEVLQTYCCRSCGGENELIERRWARKPDTLQEPDWYYGLHPTLADLARNNGDVPLLATAFLRNRVWAAALLVHHEFELKNDSDSQAFVELDFALGSVDDLWVGEAKKVSKLGQGKHLRREINKLLKGVECLGASGLVLATQQPTWNLTTVQAVQTELDERLTAGKLVPVVLQLTGLGTNDPHLSTIAGRRVELI